jgi:two-component system chemotaxis sensor kinase CheA
MERFHVCLQTAVANPPALPIPPPSLGCTDVDHTAEAGSGFPALVEPEDLAELAQMSGNLNRLLHRLHELLPPDDERLEALVSAVLVTGEKLFQTIYRHRFASLRAFLLPAVGAVREMAASQGKLACARLEVTNADVDRQVLLSLRASLLHLLRNTVAHGIEDPETREACGKPRTGTIVISAAVRDGQLHQSVSDDGRGFDVGALRSAAVASGAVSPERAAATPDEHAMTYALIPGLSTRAEPDALSGNGVGLTVVAEEVYALGGTIELVSRPGQSSTVHLSVPLPSASA